MVAEQPASLGTQPSSGLFEMYFASAPGALYEAIDKNPENFPQGALNILNAYINKELSLQTMTPDERFILQRASLEFFQAKPVMKKKEKVITKKQDSSFYEPPKQDRLEIDEPADGAWWDNNRRLLFYFFSYLHPPAVLNKFGGCCSASP